ncbi:MAG: MFS transporter [Candidatus Aminicenantes bacterium]|nr:MFS transporter [Candidatus Aminicenantes bacterium]
MSIKVKAVPEEKAGTRKTIRTFAVASFLNDMGSDIIAPVWPMFVTQVLKANMSALGLLDGLGEALVSLSQAASGYLSDRIRKRKIFVWTGYLCGAVSRLGYAVASVWQHLIPFKILDRLGKMRGAPRDAMVADLSTDDNRGRNFGLLRAMDNSGAVLGITTSILLLNIVGIRTIFALAAIPSVIGAVVVLVRIREDKPPERRIFKGASLKHIDRNLALYFGANAVFALGAFTYSFLLVYARTVGFKVGFVPVLYLIFTASAAILSLPFGRLSDRIGRKAVLFISFGFWAAVCLGVIAIRGMFLVPAVFILYGVHKAALEPVQRTMVAELCPPQYRASFIGGFQMVIGLCALPASVLAGFLWDKVGRQVPFYLSAGLTGVAALLLLFVREKPRVNPGRA